jgi:hypothetical protein
MVEAVGVADVNVVAEVRWPAAVEHLEAAPRRHEVRPAPQRLTRLGFGSQDHRRVSI